MTQHQWKQIQLLAGATYECERCGTLISGFGSLNEIISSYHKVVPKFMKNHEDCNLNIIKQVMNS